MQVFRRQPVHGAWVFDFAQFFVGELPQQSVIGVACAIKGHQGALYHNVQGLIHGIRVGQQRLRGLPFEEDGENAEPPEKLLLHRCQALIAHGEGSGDALERLGLQVAPHTPDAALRHQRHHQRQCQRVALQPGDRLRNRVQVALPAYFHARGTCQGVEQRHHRVIHQRRQLRRGPHRLLRVLPRGEQYLAVVGQPVGHQLAHVAVAPHILSVVENQQAARVQARERATDGGLLALRLHLLHALHPAEGAHPVEERVQRGAAPAVEPEHAAGEAPALARRHLRCQRRFADAASAPDHHGVLPVKATAHLLHRVCPSHENGVAGHAVERAGHLGVAPRRALCQRSPVSRKGAFGRAQVGQFCYAVGRARALHGALQLCDYGAVRFQAGPQFRRLWHCGCRRVEKAVRTGGPPVERGHKPLFAVAFAQQRQPRIGYGRTHRLPRRQRERKLADKGLGRVHTQTHLHPNRQRDARVDQCRGGAAPQAACFAHLRGLARAQQHQPHVGVAQRRAQVGGFHQCWPPVFIFEEEQPAFVRIIDAMTVEGEDVVSAVTHGLHQRIEGGWLQLVDDHCALLVQGAQAVRQLLARPFREDRRGVQRFGQHQQHAQGQLGHRDGRGRRGTLRVAAQRDEVFAHEEASVVAQEFPR